MTAVLRRIEQKYSKTGIMVLWAVFFFGIFAFFPALTLGETSEEDAIHTGTAPEKDHAVAFTEKTTLLIEIPEDHFVVADSVRTHSGEGMVGLVYQNEPDSFRACVNDSCGPYVERVAKDMPFFSPNGRHWAAIVRSAGRTHVLLNGRMGHGYDMVRNLCFSPDSMKLAYVASQGGENFTYVNQDRYGPVLNIGADGLVFSNDSRFLAFAAQTDQNSWTLMLNGEPGPAWEGFLHVTFSPDSKRLAYAARKGGKWRLVEETLSAEGRKPKTPAGGDKEVEEGYTNIKRIVFCPQSKRLGYVARADKKDVLIIDGQRIGEAHDLIASGPLFSMDGNRLAYAVMDRGPRDKVISRMVIDNTPSPAYDAVGVFYFSDRGDFVYMAQQDEKARIVYNGNAHAFHTSVSLPLIAPKTGRLAYSFLEDGQWAVNIGGKKGPGYDWVENLIFCPNGERFVYVAVREGETVFEHKYLLVEDDKILGTYSWAGLPAFSPDGRHLAYAAAEQGEAFLVIDGQKGKERFFSFLKGAPLGFTADGIVEGFAIRDVGKKFYHVRAELGADRGMIRAEDSN